MYSKFPDGKKGVLKFENYLKHICDVGSSHPGAVVGPKGWAVRPLKWHVSWVQNVNNTAFICSDTDRVLAYIGETF